MTRLLVVNHGHSHVCGIHDLGLRLHRCLAASDKFDVDYAACANTVEFEAATDGYDAVIVNHRDDLTPWAATPLPVPKIAVLHQYEEATADFRAAWLQNRFDWIIALDPTLKPQYPRLVAVGRPIPDTLPGLHPYWRRGINPITIGSFGFAFPHKGFADVAQEIAEQCSDVIYNLHMPEAFFNGAEGLPIYTDAIIKDCFARMQDGETHRELRVSIDHRPETDLVALLAANDVNCLFYAPGQPDAGQSSALDYLIAARRPMLLSEASMFRSAWNAPRWPATRLGDVLANYGHYQEAADRLYAWHHGRLANDIEALMEKIL